MPKNKLNSNRDKKRLQDLKKEVAQTITGFRKFVTTNMIGAKVNPSVKEMLLGHKTVLHDNYFLRKTRSFCKNASKPYPI
jgi:hypothetical protein